MDLLDNPSGTKPRRRIGAWIAACAGLIAIVLASCLGARPPRAATFPHDVHVTEKGLACTMCHLTAKTADLPSMPPPELCAPCHDPKNGDPRVRANAAPDATFVQWRDRWFAQGGVFRRSSTGQLPSDVVFRHGDHTGKAQLPCTQCHVDMPSEREVPVSMPDWKRACMECHEQRGMDNRDCSKCHQRITKDTPPQSHFHAWDTRHGEIVRNGDDSSQHRCELCHDEKSSCTECHQNNAPKNHDNMFRTRTHGFLASVDRSRCYTCHRTDSCDECHRTTLPVTHRPGFGDNAQRHCNSCHLPLQDTGCVVCHPGTPSHNEAEDLPSNHQPSWNCRQCHGPGRDENLPHPDGGHQCTACHR